MKINEVNDIINFNFNDNQVGETQTKKFFENKNEITFKIKIEQIDLFNTIYFLDSVENGLNYCCLNEIIGNIIKLIIDGKKLSFKNSFIPKKIGTYSIK